MKYLKLYEEIENSKNKKININLLNDIKDLSLDIIDDGYELYVDIYASSIIGKKIICELRFNHDRDGWLNDAYYNKYYQYYNNCNLYYRIYYIKKDSNNNRKTYNNKSVVSELYIILKNMYPDENFIESWKYKNIL